MEENKNDKEQITIVSVRRTNLQTQACAEIIIPSINGEEPFGYFIDLENDVDSEIHTYIKSKIVSKEIEVLPPIIPQDEYDTIILKTKASQLLSETDHFMTIDTELSDDEIKDMKEFRKSLRTISKTTETKGVLENGLPDLPKFLKYVNGCHIVYIGSENK